MKRLDLQDGGKEASYDRKDRYRRFERNRREDEKALRKDQYTYGRWSDPLLSAWIWCVRGSGACQWTGRRQDPDRYRRNLRSCAGIRKQPDAGDNAVCKRYYRNIKGNLVSYAILAEYVIRRRRDHPAWKSRSQENGWSGYGASGDILPICKIRRETAYITAGLWSDLRTIQQHGHEGYETGSGRPGSYQRDPSGFPAFEIWSGGI